MVTPTSTSWRYFRAGVFAVVATQLAALGHLLGGGQLPDLSILLTVTVFLGGSLSGLAGSRRTSWQLFAALVASQLVFHAAFQLTTHSHGTGSWVPSGPMLVFHLAAAAATAALLAGADSMLFRLFAALHRVLVPVRTALVVELPPRWTAVIVGEAGAEYGCATTSCVSRRGPPVN
ncbi:MAG: hypothetical protein ABWZ98_18115 [Nakamurella sp.]